MKILIISFWMLLYSGQVSAATSDQVSQWATIAGLSILSAVGIIVTFIALFLVLSNKSDDDDDDNWGGFV